MIGNHPILLFLLIVVLLVFLWVRRRQRLGRPLRFRRRLPAITVPVGGRPRTAYVQLPPGHQNGAPLLIGLHGGLGRVDRFINGTGLGKRAGERGYVVAFPVAPNGWVDGRPEKGDSPEDLDFMVALVETLAQRYGIDRRQVFAIGASNGGMFAQRLATARPGLLAGAASIVASTPAGIAGAVAAGPAVPFVLMCDRNDDIMPWAGGEIRRGQNIGYGGQVIPVEDAFAIWKERNHADQPAQTRRIAGPDDFFAEVADYLPERTGAPLRFVAITGSGHGWPRWPAYRGAASFDAGEIALEFFDAIRQHFLSRPRK